MEIGPPPVKCWRCEGRGVIDVWDGYKEGKVMTAPSDEQRMIDIRARLANNDRVRGWYDGEHAARDIAFLLDALDAAQVENARLRAALEALKGDDDAHTQ